jgi:Ca2+-binding EF-hand superfamily protein
MMKLVLSSLTVAAAAALPAHASTSVPAKSNSPNAKAAAPQAQPVTRADVIQSVQKRFTAVDTNKDGFVTEAESDAAAKLAHDRVEQRLEKRGDTAFERLDSNKDGALTQAEVNSFLAARASASPKAAAGAGWDGMATRFDANKDGSISRAEFDAVHDRAAGRQADRSGTAVDRLFEGADANKDGRVSLAEATSAANTQFDALDKNRDGKLTRDEMMQARKAQGAKTSTR